MWKDRTFLSILLSLLLLLLIGWFRPVSVAVTVLPLSYNPVLESNPVSERFWVMKAQGITTFDMLLMGDSRVYRGLSPQAMQTVLQGYRILNYGFSGGGLNPVMYQAAESRLDPNSRRRSILLGVSPLTLTPRAAANEHFLQEKGRSADYAFLRQHLAPLVNLFEPLHLTLLSKLQADQPEQSGEGYYLEFHDDGWVASWTVPESPEGALSSYRDIFSSTQVNSQLVQQLMDQTRRWTQRGIKVYAFRPPSSPGMVRLEDALSGFDETDFVRQFTAAGGQWFSIPLEPYHSYDGSHLVKQSALQLSMDLAERIARSAR